MRADGGATLNYSSREATVFSGDSEVDWNGAKLIDDGINEGLSGGASGLGRRPVNADEQFADRYD